jgi:thiol-disulfide isomerase/thioredoxin
MKAFTFALCCIAMVFGSAMTHAADGSASPASPGPVLSGLAVLRFYDLPGCPVCATIHPIVDSLQKKYPGDLRVEKVDSTVDASKAAMERDGVKGHGVVLFDRNGKPVFKTTSHELNSQALNSAVDKATQTPAAGSSPASAAPTR